MKIYRTEKREALASFLRSHQKEAFSLEELCEILCPDGKGKSTVYRLIAQLTDEGILRRFSREGGGISYQYIGGDACGAHLHLRCTACGRVIHLEGGAAAPLGTLLEKEYGFRLNEGRTVLLGLCADCR